MFGKYFLIGFGYLWILISLIPLVRNDNWVFRIFEYPRAQKLLINLIVLIAFFIVADFSVKHDVVFVAALTLNLCYLGYQVWPYTILARRQMKSNEDVNSTADVVSLIISNVYQDNREIGRCADAVLRCNPDIFMAVETDEHWVSELDKQLKHQYPHTVRKALNNTYGIVMYSKFKLIDAEIKFLIEDDVPSIHTRVQLKNGKQFQLYGLHPKPPVPHETARSTERDAEILLVAKEAKHRKMPVIVAGDLNDVAWSYTTELFMKVSKLLDPRRGRGFYNTFHAKHWFFRWPLDHIFCSEEFELVELRRLPSIGSDHFPMYVKLALTEMKSAANRKEALKSDTSDEKFAEEKIESAMN
jgi:endonuclease/exonuclease/phosphatase (EEP) superfamily protein YafD